MPKPKAGSPRDRFAADFKTGAAPDTGDMETNGRNADIEGPIHRSILGWLRFVLPPRAQVHHSPNEVALGGPDGKRIVAKATRNGMIKGFGDLLIMLDGRCYIMEVKPEGKPLTGRQPEFRDECAENGVPYLIVNSIDDAREALKEWGIATKEAKLP